jgi:hypothetical protein
MKIKLLSTLLLGLTQIFVFPQTAEDHGSAKLGLWNYKTRLASVIGTINPIDCNPLGSVVLTDKSSTTWTTSWSNGIPTINTNVILAGNYDTTTNPNITACSLTINNGFSLTIADGKFVSIQNNLIITTGATLNIANRGSLVMGDFGTVTNDGTIKVNKTTTPFEKSDYAYWSSYTDKTQGAKSLKKIKNTVLVSNSNKQININSSIEMIDKVQVYDLSGRLLYQKMNVDTKEFIIQNLVSSHQVLLIKIVMQDGQIVTGKIMF